MCSGVSTRRRSRKGVGDGGRPHYREHSSGTGHRSSSDALRAGQQASNVGQAHESCASTFSAPPKSLGHAPARAIWARRDARRDDGKAGTLYGSRHLRDRSHITVFRPITENGGEHRDAGLDVARRFEGQRREGSRDVQLEWTAQDANGQFPR